MKHPWLKGIGTSTTPLGQGFKGTIKNFRSSLFDSLLFFRLYFVVFFSLMSIDSLFIFVENLHFLGITTTLYSKWLSITNKLKAEVLSEGNRLSLTTPTKNLQLQLQIKEGNIFSLFLFICFPFYWLFSVC